MKFLNLHDIVFILAITVAVHMLAKPLYGMIDNATGGRSPDAS